MADMAGIRAALAANLTSIQDETGKPQVNAYRMSNPTLPSVQVTGFDEMTPTTMNLNRGGGFSILVVVQAFAGVTTNRGAQELLDRWLWPTGDLSIWEAIESDRTLAGLVDDLEVTDCAGTQIVTLDNSTEALMSTWHIQVEL